MSQELQKLQKLQELQNELNVWQKRFHAEYTQIADEQYQNQVGIFGSARASENASCYAKGQTQWILDKIRELERQKDYLER